MVKTLSFQLFREIKKQLSEQFLEEADSLAFMIVGYFSNFNKTEIITDKPFTTGPQFGSKIKSIIDRLLANEPIQYILGEAYFYDRAFIVNEHTLIPRQETEELISLILEDIKKEKSLTILDIGTGSGCIPITIKLEAPSHNIEGIDISHNALEIARENAKELKAYVSFLQLDILTSVISKSYDLIISNPPYVLNSEKDMMQNNVLDYEPHLALFVNNNNPLLFYTRITELAAKKLNPNGRLYFEINERFGQEVVALMKSHFFAKINIHQDLNGKDRFVSGILG